MVSKEFSPDSVLEKRETVCGQCGAGAWGWAVLGLGPSTRIQLTQVEEVSLLSSNSLYIPELAARPHLILLGFTPLPTPSVLTY